MIYTLLREQFIPASLEEVWNFFSTPRNLNRMTPPDMAFRFVSGGDEPMYPGQLIQYRIALFPGVRVPWLTQITHVEPGRLFVDEQRIGPYRLWIHEHRFQRVERGVLMTDHVTYALPFSSVGDLLHPLLVRPRLEAIFNYRRQMVAELFGAGTQKAETPAHPAGQSDTIPEKI